MLQRELRDYVVFLGLETFAAPPDAVPVDIMDVLDTALGDTTGVTFGANAEELAKLRNWLNDGCGFDRARLIAELDSIPEGLIENRWIFFRFDGEVPVFVESPRRTSAPPITVRISRPV